MQQVNRVMGVDAATRLTGCVLVPGGFITTDGPDWCVVRTRTISTWIVSVRAPETKRVDRIVYAASSFRDLLDEWDPTHVVFEQYAPGAGGFANAKPTAEIVGAMKYAAARRCEVDAAHIATVRKALLNRVLPCSRKEAKRLVQEFLLDHGAPEAFRSSLDLCDALAVADHRLGLLGFGRLGVGPLASKRKAVKKRKRAKVAP